MLRLYETMGGRPPPSKELLRAIRSVRTRWRLKVAARGLATVLAASFVVFLASTYGMDKLRFTPESVLIFRVGTYLALLAIAIRYLVLPLSKSVSDQRVALYIEEREPSMQAELISAVELRSRGDDSPELLSPALAEKLVQSAADRCRDIQFGHGIDRQGLRRSSGALAGVLLTGALLLIVSPSFMRNGAPFLFFPWTSPHAPIVPAPDFIGRTEAGGYGDFMHQSDYHAGLVLEALDANGLADNTIVIFTSDNGPEPGQKKWAQSKPFRGLKWSSLEGGNRVAS